MWCLWCLVGLLGSTILLELEAKGIGVFDLSCRNIVAASVFAGRVKSADHRQVRWLAACSSVVLFLLLRSSVDSVRSHSLSLLQPYSCEYAA